jgi:hypothetical protein
LTPPSPAPLWPRILRARVQMLTNHISRTAGTTKALWIVAGVALLGAPLALGALSAGSLQEAAARAPLPGVPSPAGGPYVNVGFWLAVLGSSVLSFRLMEALYRAQDTRILGTWPVALRDLFVDRLLACLGEALGLAALIALFFLPVWGITQDPRALGGGLLAVVGALLSVPVGLAVQLYAGALNFLPAEHGRRESPLSRLARTDVGGGTAAAFAFSPGVGLLSALGWLLLLKLGCADEWFVRGGSRLFWISLGGGVGAGLVGLQVARSHFLRHYPTLLARFTESDLVQFESGYAYHRSATQGPQGWFERWVPARLLPLYRKDRLQLGRRYPMLRLLMGALWITTGLLAWSDALSPMWLAGLPTAYLALLAAPHARLQGEDLEPGYAARLPIRPSDAFAANLLATARESFLSAAPSAALIGLMGGGWAAWGWAGAALLGPTLALPGLLFVARRLGARAGWLAGLALCAGLALALPGFFGP